MPLPENCKLRKGDIVIVHAIVDHVNKKEQDENYRISLVPIGSPHSSFFLSRKHLVGLFSRSFEVDERVQVIRQHKVDGVPMTTGTVINTHGSQVWMALDTGETQIVEANNIEPIDPVDDDFVEPVKPPSAPDLEDVKPFP